MSPVSKPLREAASVNSEIEYYLYRRDTNLQLLSLDDSHRGIHHNYTPRNLSVHLQIKDEEDVSGVRKRDVLRV